MLERAAFLPGLNADALQWEAHRFDRAGSDLTVLLPVLGKGEIEAVATHVRHQARKHLKTFPVARIVDAIDRAIARLLDRQDPYRRKMEDLLPIITGYDREMVRLGLSGYLKTFRKPELLRFLAEDFPNPAILDDFQPLIKGGFGRAHGPDLLAHIWAGNVPGLPLWSLVAGLLVKAGNIGKVASAEPMFAVWFAQLLAEVEPDLAECLAIVWWKGGDSEPETALLNQADVALGFGRNESLAAIQNRVPITTRFLAYGHKVSFAMVSVAALDPAKATATARSAAYDVVRYDQQGCFAPHVFFVERGGAVSPEIFTHYVAHELAAFEKKFPREAMTLAEASSAAAWRHSEEMTPGGQVIGDESGAWSVAYQAQDNTFRPSSLNRAIRIVAVGSLADVADLVAPYRAVLQTVGIAATPKHLFDLAAALGAVGVTRITALGDMTAPEAGWHHDGRFNLLDLVRITEIEGRAETAADRLASYVD
ncbi:MAG: acyl-CoA reductase [Proteobacteria bacterium]|nr:acyl-CoA reductase [Pseudomonadota bacterium]